MAFFWFAYAFVFGNLLENTESCSYGEPRLFKQAQTQYYGMLQICNNSSQVWEAVCDYSWSCSESIVACKQLGNTNPFPEYSSDFGPWDSIGFGPYSSCSTAYTSLFDCSVYGSSYLNSYSYCDPNRDTVGINCNNNSDICTTGNVKLVGGNITSEGRVEYCYDGRWSALCTSYTLSQITASKICFQLGYKQPNYAAIYRDGRFGTIIDKPHVRYISCNTNQFNVRECSYDAYSSTSCNLLECTYQYGIKCYDYEGCHEGNVRFVNGTVEKEGRLEICNNGIWGGICSDDGFSQTNGYVVCKQLGYDNGAIVYYNSEYGDGNGPILYSDVSCNGHEDGIYDCEKDSYDDIYSRSRTRLIGLLCRDDCESDDIRLVGGDNEGEGTVEICYDHIWGLISDAGWNDSDAEVVCTQLGYQIEIEDGPEAISGSFYGKPKKAIHYGSVNCDGSEQVLTNCHYVQYSLEHGKELNIHVEVAGVNCQGNLTHDNISITDSLTTSISTHLTTTGKLQHVSFTTTTTGEAGLSDTTSTSSEVIILSVGITVLIFGVIVVIIGIPLIGVFICILRKKSVHSNNNDDNNNSNNNKYINNKAYSNQSSVVKQSFRSTLPNTRQPSKMDDCIKMDTLPPIPPHRRQTAPQSRHQGKLTDDCMAYEEMQHI